MIGHGLRIAIVGAGRMGATRARAAHELGADLAVICDENITLGREVASLYDSNPLVISEADEIQLDEIDAVFVCTPPHTRGEVEKRALETDTALFVEKPISVDYSQIACLAELVKSSKAPNVVGYMNRHRDAVIQTRAELRSQNILGISANWVCGTYGVDWWSDKDKSGGPVNEQATHLLDLCRFLVGEVEEVSAMTTGEGATSASISMRFENGAMGSIFYSCESTEKAIRLQVFTEDETVHLSGWEFDRIGASQAADPPTRSRAERNAIFLKEVEDFFHLVNGEPGSRTLCTLQDAMQTQLLVDAVKRATRTRVREKVGRVFI